MSASSSSKLRVERRLLTLLDDAQMRVLIGYKPKTFRQARVHLAALLILDTGLRSRRRCTFSSRIRIATTLLSRCSGRARRNGSSRSRLNCGRGSTAIRFRVESD